MLMGDSKEAERMQEAESSPRLEYEPPNVSGFTHDDVVESFGRRGRSHKFSGPCLRSFSPLILGSKLDWSEGFRLEGCGVVA